MKHYRKIRDPLESPTSADRYRESASKPGRAEFLDPVTGLWQLSKHYRRRDLRNPALFTREQ